MDNYSCKYEDVRAKQWNGKNGEDIIAFCQEGLAPGESLEFFKETGYEGQEPHSAIAYFKGYCTDPLSVDDFIVATGSPFQLFQFIAVDRRTFLELYEPVAETEPLSAHVKL